ncbi:pyridoxamine 5'-phosphate oxidase family protein [Clostridium sp. UBA1652]|uniref:pyridoxamine 5'-phosphate oxidase family protein n=1 Tax=Clostridium sp. UBA1652 TaxID=1946348 RepID=UPI00257ABDC4|nr:pyridoxamine 5'-phosphate oxidase family protein [Clostridium sp. UBA1652]
MEKISYTRRICKDKDKINNFVTEQRVGTLSMCTKEGVPYALPVNYVYWNEKIYIHGMGSGKKNRFLSENSSVCFTIFEELGTVTDPMPAKCDTSYLSVVVFGKATLVDDLEEKTQALTKFLDKFVPKFFKTPLSKHFVDKYRSSLDNNAVAVYCIIPEELTAKENPIDMENMFDMHKSMNRHTNLENS